MTPDEIIGELGYRPGVVVPWGVRARMGLDGPALPGMDACWADGGPGVSVALGSCSVLDVMVDLQTDDDGVVSSWSLRAVVDDAPVKGGPWYGIEFEVPEDGTVAAVCGVILARVGNALREWVIAVQGGV